MEQATDRVNEQDTGQPENLSPIAWKKFWQAELDAEEKRSREWRKRADFIVRRYLDKRRDQGPQYNIGNAEFRVNLFSTNVRTLQAFLYGRVPTADVSRRFADSNDDQARVGANILQRMLNTSIETDGGDFSSVLRCNLEDFLVPGMGVARIRYEVATETVEHQAVLSPDTGEVFAEAYTEERMTYEDAVVDYVHWRDFRWSYARVWSDVWWIGFDIYLNRDQARKRFGPRIADKLTYEKNKKPDTMTHETGETREMRNSEYTTRVTEIWSKRHLQTFWYSPDVDFILERQPDLLELDGFYPVPRPMVANLSTTLFQPVPFFMMAQDLYNEVDQLSTRINIITNAVKVVGLYDKSTPELKNMLGQTVENDMIPVDNWAMMAEKGGVKGIVDFWPVDTIVQVLTQLRQMRVETIELLYQVTGMSDIMRGASGNQYEAASTGRLKARFASINVQYLQDEFSRWASDLLTLKAEVISKHFEPQTILEQSNILQSHDAQLVIPAIQLIQQPGKAEWRIQVKPETVAMVDWAELKADRTEFLTATATFLQSSASILQSEPSAGVVLLELMKWGLAGFKGGQEIESVIDQAVQQYQRQTMQRMQQQQQQQSPEAMKAQADMMKTQAKLKADLQKQQDKFVKEMQKLAAQTKADLVKTRAETEATIVKETVQADQNIREKLAVQQ